MEGSLSILSRKYCNVTALQAVVSQLNHYLRKTYENDPFPIIALSLSLSLSLMYITIYSFNEYKQYLTTPQGATA
jgi:hypothetical protein